MSIEALGQFLESAAGDRMLAEQIRAEVGGRVGEDAVATVVTLARQRGFDVEADDVVRLRTTAGQAGGGEEGDLSDAELELVAGGGWDFMRTVFAVATFGESEVS